MGVRTLFPETLMLQAVIQGYIKDSNSCLISRQNLPQYIQYPTSRYYWKIPFIEYQIFMPTLIISLIENLISPQISLGGLWIEVNQYWNTKSCITINFVNYNVDCGKYIALLIVCRLIFTVIIREEVF